MTQETQTIFSIIENAKLANNEMYFVYDLNVLDYYKLGDNYDSDLKKEVFKKTPEYVEKLEKLKKMKAEMLKTAYYIQQDNKFGDYDIKKKGFEIDFVSQEFYNPPKSIKMESNFFYLKSVPTKREPDPSFGSAIEKLFIPMDETNALEVENNRSDIVIYYFFTLSGKEVVFFQATSPQLYAYNTKASLLKSDKVRVVVANKSTGKIYYDKTF